VEFQNEAAMALSQDETTLVKVVEAERDEYAEQVRRRRTVPPLPVVPDLVVFIVCLCTSASLCVVVWPAR